MGRPKKTESQYLAEYSGVILGIVSGIPYRKIAEEYGCGVSTVQRLHNMGLHLHLVSDMHKV